MVASGALAFDCKGWFFERILVWLGLIKPELFTVVIKTLTLEPVKGNLCWWKPWTWLPFSPWSCVRYIPGQGIVNKVGLTNKGFDWWCEKVAPTIDFKKYKVVVSILGNKEELVIMAKKLNKYPLVAIEINYSCPNSGSPMEQTDAVIECTIEVNEVSIHPVLLKLSVAQNYLAIERGVRGVAQAIALNSVPWKIAFPNGEITPLALLEKKVDGGGGGVSGKPAQRDNWRAVKELTTQGETPVICPSIMEQEDLLIAERLGASAVSFGAIHLFDPCKPTKIVQADMSGKLN